MPNKVETFVPLRIMEYALHRLRQISLARGYNTHPAVYERWEDADASDAKHLLFVEAEVLDPVQHGVGTENSGPRINAMLVLRVVGICRYETEWPRKLAMALEQDVRTALHSDVANIREFAGRGASMRFGTCEYDGGELAPKKEAGFRLQVRFTWSQSSEW